jgi:hypothetical protein
MYAQRSLPPRTPKYPRQETTTLRAPGDVMDRMRDLAIADTMPVNEVIVAAMQHYWATHPKRARIEQLEQLKQVEPPIPLKPVPSDEQKPGGKQKK